MRFCEGLTTENTFSQYYTPPVQFSVNLKNQIFWLKMCDESARLFLFFCYFTLWLFCKSVQVELIMALEEEFETEIPDADGEKITTVQAAIDYINSTLR